MRFQALATAAGALAIGFGLCACDSSEPFTNQRQVSGVVSETRYSDEAFGPYTVNFRFENEPTEYACSTVLVPGCNTVGDGEWYEAEVGSRDGQDNQVIKITKAKDS